MTILDALSALRDHGPLQVSHAALDDLGLYRRLLLAAPTSGRCPVLRAGHALTSVRDAAVLTKVPRRDAGAVLAARFPTGCVYHPRCLAPFDDGVFPGLAPPTPGLALLKPAEIVESAVEEAEAAGDPLLGLVPVSRPADVPAAVGWSGTAGSRAPWDDVAALSAVLRSWEDRFGAVLVRMGRTTLELAVAAPPWERSECLAIAAEHYALCDDTYAGNPGTLRDYANLLRGNSRWSFWWD